MGLLSRYKREKLKAEAFYKEIKPVRCPYFSKEVVFNSDGFNHLQFSGGSERDKLAQLLKFNLLPLVPEVIRRAGTIQEYRKEWGKVGRKKSDGQEMKEIQYWGLIAIVKYNEEYLKIRVILRRVGDGNITFWSVMPDQKIRAKDTFHLASGNISED